MNLKSLIINKNIIVLIVVVLSMSFSSKMLNNSRNDCDAEISCEIQEINMSSIGPVIRLSPEGLFLYFFKLKNNKSKYFFLDYTKIKYAKIEEFRCFVFKSDFYNYNLKRSGLLGDQTTKIVLSDNNNCNTIFYDHGCFDEKLDSLILYMNSFIPKKYLKDYKIDTHEKGLRKKCL